MKGGEWNKKTDVDLFQIIHLLFNMGYYKLNLSKSSEDNNLCTANSIFDDEDTTFAKCKQIVHKLNKERKQQAKLLQMEKDKLLEMEKPIDNEVSTSNKRDRNSSSQKPEPVTSSTKTELDDKTKSSIATKVKSQLDPKKLPDTTLETFILSDMRHTRTDLIYDISKKMIVKKVLTEIEYL